MPSIWSKKIGFWEKILSTCWLIVLASISKLFLFIWLIIITSYSGKCIFCSGLFGPALEKSTAGSPNLETNLKSIRLEASIPTWGDAIVWSDLHHYDRLFTNLWDWNSNTFCPITLYLLVTNLLYSYKYVLDCITTSY